MLKRHCLSAAILLSHSVSFAADLPEVVVEEAPWFSDEYNSTASALKQVDSAEALKKIPGANVNRNGGLTGIAQYRGLFGDRIAVQINNAEPVTGGPNAMDAPLSYIPATLMDSISVDRGVSSVSKSQESLGGMISAKSISGEFADSEKVSISGQINSNYQSQNSANNTGIMIAAANNHHKISADTSYDKASDSEYADGDIDTTEYLRRRYNLNYGFQNQDSTVNINWGKNNTGDSGTPALPMDITAIDSDLGSIDGSHKFGEFKVSWFSDYSHVYHEMDNFKLRPEPMMGPRETHANGQRVAHKIMVAFPLASGELTLGADHSENRHSATVYNPDMPMFLVENFNNAHKDISGVFTEWQFSNEQLSIELGARSNKVKMDADEVTSTMMGMLANAFNNADRSETYNNRDLVIKTAYRLDEQWVMNANLSSKERAPSFQERFLWMPMQSTGGLADGKTYVGNLDLNSETSNEINLGIDYNNSTIYLSLQAFYRDVNDYIQGTPEGAGMADLKYNNIDAKLYGGEFSYGISLSDNLSIDGHLSYVRGKDKNNSDNLYRISPLNNQVALTYQYANWQTSLISEIYQHQNNVASYNAEEESAGYGLLHFTFVYNMDENLQLRAGVDNLTDKSYQDHLAGYNRVSGNSDIPLNERLYGTGRSLNLGATYKF